MTWWQQDLLAGGFMLLAGALLAFSELESRKVRPIVTLWIVAAIVAGALCMIAGAIA